MPITCAKLDICHHRTKFYNLAPLSFDMNSLTLYLTLNRIITINSDNYALLYIFWYSFTHTCPSWIYFSYFLSLASLCLPYLQFRLSIISNYEIQKDTLNYIPIQWFGNMIIFHQHWLARDCGMVGINCIGKCIYLIFNTSLIALISSINTGAFSPN